MSKTEGPRGKRWLGRAMAVALVALSFGAAGPAQAATTSSGCTVSPYKLVFAGFDTSGTKLFDARIGLSCNRGSASRTVQVQQEIWEEDWDGWLIPNGDDKQGAYSFTRSLTASGGSTTIHSTHRLPNTESGNEEMYQKVRFRVISNNLPSPWTTWERTSYTSMPN